VHLWLHFFMWSSWYWKIYIFLELLVLLHRGASGVHFHDFNIEVLGSADQGLQLSWIRSSQYLNLDVATICSCVWDQIH
jgi:hypothetical protein